MQCLKICGRHELSEFEESGFQSMISIGDPEDDFDDLRFPGISPTDHLILKFADVVDPLHPSVVTEESLEPLFVWLYRHSVEDRLLVHCAAGISRSPAVALLSLCAIEPEIAVSVHLETVVAAAESPHILPNPLVLEVGQKLLQRGNELTSVVKVWQANQKYPFGKDF